MAVSDNGEISFTVMGKVPMTSVESAFVAEQIATFAGESPTRVWLLPFVAKLSALPLYVGWGDTVGLRANGEIIRWPTEGEFIAEWSLDDPFWIRMALVEGAKKYPLLTHLIPQRPTDARDCRCCSGTGKLPVPALQHVICACGGTGWLEFESTRDSSSAQAEEST